MKLFLIAAAFCICIYTGSVNAGETIDFNDSQPILSAIHNYDKNELSLIQTAVAEKFLITAASSRFEISVFNKNERNNSFTDSFFTFKSTEKGKILECIKYTSTLDKKENCFITFVSEHNTRAP